MHISKSTSVQKSSKKILSVKLQVSVYITTVRDVRSAGIPIPEGSHSHSPGMTHSREYGNFGLKNLIPIPVIFPGNMTHSRGIPHSRKIPFLPNLKKIKRKNLIGFEGLRLSGENARARISVLNLKFLIKCQVFFRTWFFGAFLSRLKSGIPSPERGIKCGHPRLLFTQSDHLVKKYTLFYL